MPYFVVTNESDEQVIVEAPSNGVALTQVAGAVSVRIALHHESQKYLEAQRKDK